MDKKEGKSLSGYEGQWRFSPDGLTEQIIDGLLWEVDAAGAVGPCATSALMDGTAAERRYRRQARRAVAAVVRVLPVRWGVFGPSGREAA